MEYFRDEKNKIQADMAYRLGKIAVQYEKSNFLEDKYSSTLDICILQNLLTHCVELFKVMERHDPQKKYLKANLKNETRWGLHHGLIKTNTFKYDNELTVYDVLNSIRNSLSHPTGTDIEAEFPSTGYTTVPSKSGKISHFCFIESPDTKNNRPRIFNTEIDANTHIKRYEGKMPKDVGIIQLKNNKFSLSLNREIFARVFRIDITCSSIHELVIELANYLAQPIQDEWSQYEWDNRTSTRLVA